MSQYDKLDALIVGAIKEGCYSFSSLLCSKSLFDEAMRLSHAVGRDTDRIVDGRLQALRRRGLIVYVTGWGWRVKEAG